MKVEQDWPEFDAVWESIEARMGDSTIECTTCGKRWDPFLVRQRAVYKDRCFECAKVGRSQMWKKVERPVQR